MKFKVGDKIKLYDEKKSYISWQVMSVDFIKNNYILKNWLGVQNIESIAFIDKECCLTIEPNGLLKAIL